MATSPEMLHGCGLPMSKNPHPMAGSVSIDNDFGYQYECIPCLVQTRNRVGRSWRDAQTVVNAAVEVSDSNFRRLEADLRKSSWVEQADKVQAFRKALEDHNQAHFTSSKEASDGE